MKVSIKRRWIMGSFNCRGTWTTLALIPTIAPKRSPAMTLDVVTEVQFGGSEGIYLDCYAEGRDSAGVREETLAPLALIRPWRHL